MGPFEEMLDTLQRIEKKLENLPEATGERRVDPEDGKAVYDAKELAEVLGMKRQTIYYQTKKGRIPHIKAGSKILYPKVAINRWLLEGAENNSQNEKDVDEFVEPK